VSTPQGKHGAASSAVGLARSRSRTRAELKTAGCAEQPGVIGWQHLAHELCAICDRVLTCGIGRLPPTVEAHTMRCVVLEQSPFSGGLARRGKYGTSTRWWIYPVSPATPASRPAQSTVPALRMDRQPGFLDGNRWRADLRIRARWAPSRSSSSSKRCRLTSTSRFRRTSTPPHSCGSSSRLPASPKAACDLIQHDSGGNVCCPEAAADQCLPKAIYMRVKNRTNIPMGGKTTIAKKDRTSNATIICPLRC